MWMKMIFTKFAAFVLKKIQKMNTNFLVPYHIQWKYLLILQ